MWFYGWGFYALGQDDTLERKLTGQPVKSLAPPTTAAAAVDVDASSQHNSPGDALPYSDERRSSGNGNRSNAQARATAVEDDGVVVIDIDELTEESSKKVVNNVALDAGKGDDGDERWAGFKQRVSRILLSPNIIAVAIGVVIAMIAPLQKMLFDNPRAVLRPLGAAFEASLGGLG